MIRRGDNLADIPAPAETLEPFRKLRIRTLLGRLPDESAPAIVALFDLVYDGAGVTMHETGRAVSYELENTDKTVGDLIDGWRPPALRAQA